VGWSGCGGEGGGGSLGDSRRKVRSSPANWVGQSCFWSQRAKGGWSWSWVRGLSCWSKAMMTWGAKGCLGSCLVTTAVWPEFSLSLAPMGKGWMRRAKTLRMLGS